MKIVTIRHADACADIAAASITSIVRLPKAPAFLSITDDIPARTRICFGSETLITICSEEQHEAIVAQWREASGRT